MPRTRSIPTDPAPAAHAITGWLLPAYRAAVLNGRAQEVATHLAHALTAQKAHILARAEQRSEDGASLDASTLARLDHRHREAIWSDFLPFLAHGPVLLDHLGTALLTREEQAALAVLGQALRHGEDVLSAWRASLRYGYVRERPDLPSTQETYAKGVAARNAEAGPTLAAWLQHGPALVDLLRRHPPAGTRPVGRPALPPAVPPNPPDSHRGTTP